MALFQPTEEQTNFVESLTDDIVQCAGGNNILGLQLIFEVVSSYLNYLEETYGEPEALNMMLLGQAGYNAMVDNMAAQIADRGPQGAVEAISALLDKVNGVT